MGRWTQYDEDDYRLPEGMKRVGYDADTQRYYFRDKAGKMYQGSEGAQFGHMTPVDEGDERPGMFSEGSDDEEDLEAAPARSDGYQALAIDTNHPARGHGNYRTGAYRTLFPFFLMIAVVLLLLWRILSPSSLPPPPPCPGTSIPYYVKSGDTCWDIAQIHGCSLDALKGLNKLVDCSKLMPGDRLCIPAPGT